MEYLSEFFSWAWARHHNVLSWYIRPLFILPFVFFAYKHSRKGLVLTVIALLTSMFWFPAPVTVDPAVEQFLQAEKDYILGEWSLAKFLVSLTVPAFLWGRDGLWEIGTVGIIGRMWRTVKARRRQMGTNLHPYSLGVGYELGGQKCLDGRSAFWIPVFRIWETNQMLRLG